jgi:hypothetical protein
MALVFMGAEYTGEKVPGRWRRVTRQQKKKKPSEGDEMNMLAVPGTVSKLWGS